MYTNQRMLKASLLVVLLLKLIEVKGQNVSNIAEKFPTECTTPNGGKGWCIEIQKCTKFITQIEQNNSETFAFIKQSQCGPLNEDPLRPKVCCGDDINFRTAQSNTPQEIILPDYSVTTPLPEHLRDPLPELCGTQRVIVNNRIFGGTHAEIGEFPWMARLVHINSYNYTSLGCSGFLIHRRFVLTAAHCLAGRNVQSVGKLHSVILGSHNSTNKEACVKTEQGRICSETPKLVAALAVIVHKDYDKEQHLHDIALIHLKDKVSFTDFIKAICIPKVEFPIPEYTISGWGKTELDSSSSVKLKVTIPSVDREYCNRQYRNVGMNIGGNQLCAGGQYGKDSCAGDSGGPLMMFNLQDQKWYASGIVSYGYGCGQQGWPGVYTNIPLYYNWIVDNIRKNK